MFFQLFMNLYYFAISVFYLYLLKSQLILTYHFHGEMRMLHTILHRTEPKQDNKYQKTTVDSKISFNGSRIEAEARFLVFRSLWKVRNWRHFRISDYDQHEGDCGISMQRWTEKEYILLLFCAVLFLNTWRGKTLVQKETKLQGICMSANPIWLLYVLVPSGQYRNKLSHRSLKFSTFK